MNSSTIDGAVFAFLASCVGDFAQWPQCSIVALHGNNGGGRLFGVLFKATAGTLKIGVSSRSLLRKMRRGRFVFFK